MTEHVTAVTVLVDGSVLSKGELPGSKEGLDTLLLAAFRESPTGPVPFSGVDWSYALAAVEGDGARGPVAVTFFAAPDERGKARPLTTLLCLFGDDADQEREVIDLAVSTQARVARSQGYKSPNIELRGLAERPVAISLLLVVDNPMEAGLTGAIVPPTWSAIVALRDERARLDLS